MYSYNQISMTGILSEKTLNNNYHLFVNVLQIDYALWQKFNLNTEYDPPPSNCGKNDKRHGFFELAIKDACQFTHLRLKIISRVL